jgi:DNA-binding GntR family transcriptional regulator
MGNALRMALRRCSDDELEILVAKADLLVAAGQQDAMTLFEASYVFFEAVTRVTGNSVFIGVISQAQLAIQRNLRGWEPFMTSPLSARRLTVVSEMLSPVATATRPSGAALAARHRLTAPPVVERAAPRRVETPPPHERFHSLRSVNDQNSTAGR